VESQAIQNVSLYAIIASRGRTLLAQVKRRRVLGLRPALRNAIQLPGSNRLKDGHRSLLIKYLRDILKDGPRAKCKLLQPFPPTSLWAVSADGCPQGEITWGQPPSAVRSSKARPALWAVQNQRRAVLEQDSRGRLSPHGLLQGHTAP